MRTAPSVKNLSGATLALLAVASLIAGWQPRSFARQLAGTSECCTARVFRTNKIDKDDPVRTIEITSSRDCCGKPARKVITVAPTACTAKVDVQYCHTQIINNTPITFCYWNHLQEPGVFHPDRQCCQVTLKDVNGATYCVPLGKTLVLGPIIFVRQQADAENAVPPAPPITTVESIEGGRTVTRYIPSRQTPAEQSDVYVYDGGRLFIVTPPPPGSKITSQQ